MVCITPRSQGHKISQKTLRCASHRRVRLRGVHHTAESSSAVCFLPQSQAPWCASHRRVKIEIFTSLCVIEYLGEIKTEFQNTLACLLGVQMGSNHEKNWRSKILRHTPFKYHLTGGYAHFFHFCKKVSSSLQYFPCTVMFLFSANSARRVNSL